MTDPDEYPPGTLAAEMQNLSTAVENLKQVWFAEVNKALTPLVDFMSKVGRHDRP